MNRHFLCAIAALLGLAFAPYALAQAKGCDSPESHQLDFWLGDWDLSYAKNGQVVHSANRITRVLDGCVILEEFTGAPGTALDGRSVSTYDPAVSRWKQAWVDNQGSYLDFDGEIAPGEVTFARSFTREGKKTMQRMIFRDIKRDSLKWLWQQSTDGGATWSTQWEIDYRRRPA